MSGRKVVVTGLGLVTPLGIGVGPFWEGLMEGRSGVRPLQGVEIWDMPTTHYGQLPALDWDRWLEPRESALWSGASKLAVVGGMLASEDAGKGLDWSGPRTGVLLGTGYGCSYEFEQHYENYFAKGWKKTKPISVPKIMSNAPASHLAMKLGARGMNATISTACSSGAIAAGMGAQQIRAGTLDVCFAGGLDFICNSSIVAAWNALRVLSRRNDPTASRPFSKDRDGLVFSEGCSLVVLEERERALGRGARIYAEISGVGATNDATNIVAPDGVGEAEAIRMALADAGVGVGEIDYVNAHGTSTPLNDANETKMLKEVLGARAREIPVSSIKGHIGHAMGAAGAIEVAATALSLFHQRVPPTLHFVPGDPDCDLDYVPEGARSLSLRYAITSSFGFGGQNSVLAMGRG